MPRKYTLAEVEAAFWSRVDKSGGPDACWPWMGPMTDFGYGKFRVWNRTRTSHRLAIEFTNGPIQTGSGYHGTCVLHRCDNPPCCNPAHLWLGTNADNAADRNAKGRSAAGERNGARLHPETRARGERHGTRTHPERLVRGSQHWARRHPERLEGELNPRAKLTWADVDHIRARFLKGETKASIARDYGVSPENVYMIVTGRTWNRRVTVHDP